MGLAYNIDVPVDQLHSLQQRSRERALRAHVQVYRSFAEENEAEVQRRASMSHEERMAEFAAIQERVYGSRWHEPMRKVASWEYVAWHKK